MDGNNVVFTEIGSKIVRILSPQKIEGEEKLNVEIEDDKFFIFPVQ